MIPKDFKIAPEIEIPMIMSKLSCRSDKQIIGDRTIDKMNFCLNFTYLQRQILNVVFFSPFSGVDR